MNLDKQALSGFVKEVEDSRLRQKAETEFQRDVFARARKQHFDVKAVRIVLQRRAMEPSKRDEQDYNVHAYELALGAKKDAIEDMEQGATAREAARKHRLPRAAVTVLKAGTGNEISEPTTPHHPETGEINPGEGAADAAKLVTAQAAAPPEADTPTVNGQIPEGTEQPLQAAPPAMESCGGVESRHAECPEGRSCASEPEAGDTSASGQASTAGVAPGPQDTSDDLSIPHFLRRSVA